MLFWVIFLLSLIPCGLIGFTLTLIGFIKSIKRNNTPNKIIGGIGTTLGLVFIIGGVLGIMLLYIVIGA